MAGCKSKKRLVPAISAWFLLITCTTLFFIFPGQYLQNTYSISITIVQAIISLFVITNFSYATFMDPGIIPKASPDEDVEDDFRAPLYKSVDINGITIRMKWCCTCQFYRPPRCSHCSVCNNCIETFDHHCPWVNNCIGRRNYRHFFFFLIFLSIHMITIFIWCILFVLDHRDQLRERDSVISIVILAIIVILFIPIIGLTGFHIILVARGRTTNEQVTGKFQGGYNPFSKGCLRNYCNILCGPVHTRYLPTKRKKRYTSSNNGYDSLHGSSRYDKSMQVYVDEGNKLLYSKTSKDTVPRLLDELNDGKKVNNHGSSFSKSSNGYRNDGSAMNMERLGGGGSNIESMEAMASQSRDCEPSPPTSPRKASLPSLSSMSSSPLPKLSSNLGYKTNSGSTQINEHLQQQQQCNICSALQTNIKQQQQHSHQANHVQEQNQQQQQAISKPYMSSPHHCSQSHNLYHNHPVTMRKMDNGKTETTFPVTVNNTPVNSSTRYHLFHPSETETSTAATVVPVAAATTTSLSSSSQPLYNNSCVQCEAAKNYREHSHPTKSPAKSSSVTEISSQSYSPCQRHHHQLNSSQTGGLVIYYSPDAGGYVKNTNTDYNPKFASETELQKLHHHQALIDTSSSFGETNGDCNGSTSTNSSQHFTKRPMSFMKALEMSNKLERAGPPRPPAPTKNRGDEVRQSQYEMNYEISV